MNNYLESFVYTLISIVGSIIPFLLLSTLIFFNGKDFPKYHEIIGNGELAIVCISLGIGVIYTLISNANKIGKTVYKTASYIGLHFVFWITIFLLIAGVTIYSSSLKDIYIANTTEKTVSYENDVKIRNSAVTANQDIVSDAEKGQKRIVKFSVVFFVWIIIAVFITRYFDKIDVKFVKERSDDVDNLLNRVEND